MRTFLKLTFIVILILAVAGCTSREALGIIEFNASPTASSTPTEVPSLTPSSSPSQPPEPSNTPLPTSTASQTTTPTPSPTPFVHFAVIGDLGPAGDDAQEISDLVKSWEPDIILTTGDNNWPDGEAEYIDANIGQYYHEYISPYLGEYGAGAEINRFFPTLGNHDMNANDGQPYLDYFSLPGNERYYDFVWGPVHFFALSADSREPDGVGRSSIQAQWLREQLAQSASPWKVIYMHQSPYSSAVHGSIDWMQWPFEEWGASIVISGHNQVYERLKIVDLTYIVSGMGGGPRYAFEEFLDISEFRYRDMNGALLVNATGNRFTLQFINVAGEIIDEVVLEK